MSFGSLLEGVVATGLASQVEKRLVIPEGDLPEALDDINACLDDAGMPHITIDQLPYIDRGIIHYVEGRIGNQVGL